MTTTITSMVNNHEEAGARLAEGRQAFANGDHPAARISFIEAARLDPSNRQIWLCLASVSTGSERDGYLTKAGLKHSKKKPEDHGAKTSGSQRIKKPFRFWMAASGAVLFAFVVGIFAWKVVMPPSTNTALAASTSGYTLLHSSKGGNLNLLGKAGLFIPGGSMKNDEQFRLSYPANPPVLPAGSLFTAVGKPVLVETTATILRQPGLVGLRYSASQLPPNANENSLQVARWDGKSWEIVDRSIDLAQKVIYVSITHFSDPLFQVIAWPGSLGNSLLARQVEAANKVFFQNDSSSSAAALYEKIVWQFIRYTTPAQLASLSEADQQAYWMACNLWGDSLYKEGQFAPAGNAYQSCVKTAVDSGLKINWSDQLFSGPGYSLEALQNRYPLGINLTKLLRSGNWAAGLPADSWTLSAQSYTWQENLPVELDQLPPAVAQSVQAYESKLGHNPGDTAETSLDILVLSPQSQSSSLIAGTIEESITPFLQSSGIPDITSISLKDAVAGLSQPLAQILNQGQVSNRYLFDPIQSGEGLHTHAPVVLLRVERAWAGAAGLLTHTQQIFTVSQLPSKVGQAVGDRIAEDSTYQLTDGTLVISSLKDQWVEIGSATTNNIKTVRSYDNKSLAVGSYFACVLTRLNGVQCWGQNQVGQLGTGSGADSKTPVDVKGLNAGISQLTAGDSHACGLTVEGKLYCWGHNSSGQVGNGSITDQTVPAVVTGIAGHIVSVVAGSSHTCALTIAGKVYCWGNNSAGELGTGSKDQSLVPVLVPGLSDVLAVAAGGTHTCALLKDGSVNCWGANSSGQLGDGSQVDSPLPVQVKGLSGIVSITAGQNHTCALTSAGDVKCWGANDAGQVGSGSENAYIATPTDVNLPVGGVKAIKTLINHTCAINQSGVACWGKNDAGQLGNGNKDNQSVPVVTKLTDNQIASIGTGSDFSCIRSVNGLVYCWGGNAYGQLGIGSTQASLLPVAVTGFGSVAADPTGDLVISPVTDDSIELGSTIQIRTINVPENTQSVSYQLSYDGQSFAIIGKTTGTDTSGVEWKSAGSALDKKLVVKSTVETGDGKSTVFTSRVLSIKDTRKPSAGLSIQPSAKVIALGDTITLIANDPTDSVNGITGSGVKEIRFSVLQNGATISTPITVPYAVGQLMQVTWSAPLDQKNSGEITFQIIVVDNAGNENKIEAGGYSLSSQIQPNFFGDILVKSFPAMNGSHIDMGSKVTIQVDLTDQIQDNNQGTGLSDVSFSYSLNGGGFQGISHQIFPKGLTPGTVTSLVWDTGNPKILAGTTVRFLVMVVDKAGKLTKKTSGEFIIDDTTAPVANKTLGVITSNTPGDPFLKLSANGITDGTGSGVSKAEFKVLCNGINLFQNAPIVVINPAAAISQTIALPPQAPDEGCGYGKNIQVNLQLTDNHSNVNPVAATGSATYLYDLTAPPISDIIVPAQIESLSPLILKVLVAREPGGSPVRAVTLDVKCDNTLIQEFPISSPTSLEGEHDISWTPAESSASCPWGKSHYNFIAWAVDENGNGNPPTAPTTRSSINYVDTKAPAVWINVNGTEKAALPAQIVQPLVVKINADDGAGGSGVNPASLSMKIFYSAGYGKLIDRYPNNGPYPCGPLKFVFDAKDNNFARNNKTGELVEFSNLTAQPLSGSITFPDAVNTYTVQVSATVKEPCGGLKNGNFQIIYGSDQVQIPSTNVQRNADNATVTVSGDWTLTKADKEKYSGTVQSIKIKFTAINNENAQVSGSVDLDKTIPIKINEAPTNIALSSGTIAENKVSGSPVGIFTTTDPDKADTFTYSLVAGTGSTDNAKFILAGDTLQTAARFDFETKNSYTIRIRSTDNGGLHVDQVFTITVTDVNEPPIITSNGGGTATVSVPENTNLVTTVTAVDPDAGASLAYSISGGADAAKFGLDPSTHQLSFVSPPDFEHPTDSGGNNIYDVIVQVSDGSLTASQAIAVKVTDVNDSPVITSNGGGDTASVSVPENSAAPVTTVAATDPVAAATLTYSITGGLDAARFILGSSSHILAFVTPPDFETPTDSNGDNIYHVTVNVTDGSVADSQDIAVTVTNVNEAPKIISNPAILVAENSTDPVTTVSVIDPDAGTVLAFSIVGGADAAKFTINSSTGVLSFITVPDFENPTDSNGDNIYEVTIKVSDGALTDTRAFTVLVTDVIEP